MTTIHDDLRDHMLAVERELVQVKRERDAAVSLASSRERAAIEARQAFAAADKRRHEAEAWAEELRRELRFVSAHLCEERCKPAKGVHTEGCALRQRLLAGNLDGS